MISAFTNNDRRVIFNDFYYVNRFIVFINFFFLQTERNYYVGSLLELELEFRTSEKSGILLSISEPEGYPALSLEFNHSKVRFSVYI